MRLLLDTCVWGGAREQLRAQGHDEGGFYAAELHGFFPFTWY